MKIKTAYQLGRAKALEKLALGPPTQVDQFVADVEQAQDVPPTPALPPMSGMGMDGMGGPPPALDGTTPMQMPSTSPPTPMDTIGSTVGTPPPPMMGALGG